MFRPLKSRISARRLIYTPTRSYESIWTRFLRFFKKTPITSQSLYHSDLQNSSPLSEHMPFQYKSDETQPQSQTPIMELEAQLREIEQNKEISEIERLRMLEIDRSLGTNTHFHEVEPDEERLSSEFVMSREALREFGTKEDFLETLVNLDPQQRVARPKIRNFDEFAKQIYSMRKYPQHLKENTIQKYKHDSLNDHYRYLEFTVQDQMIENRLRLLNSDQDFKKYMDFLGEEMMYSSHSLVRMQRIEMQIGKEYLKMVGGFNVQPLYYDEWIYYSKDPRLTANSIFDVFRVRIPPNTQDQGSIKATDIQPFDEETVLTTEEILSFLSSNPLTISEEISRSLESLKSNSRSTPLYREFTLDKDHNIMSIVLDVGVYLVLFKNLRKNQFFKVWLKGVDEVLLDNKGGAYFIRANELGRKCFLMYHRIGELDQDGKADERCVYEEKDLNFELRVKTLNNRDEGLLICQKIAGAPANEIGIIDLFEEGTSKIQRTFSRKQETFWNLKSNEEAFYFSSKGSRKIYRIFRKPESQNLSLLTHSFNKSKELLANDALKNFPSETIDTNIIHSEQKPGDVQFLREKYLVEAFQNQETYDIFFEAKENEELRNFEVFRHYVIIQLACKQREFFKVYNCKNRSFHDVLIPESLFEVQKNPLQNHQSQFFNFGLLTPHQPNRIMNYNMALREFSVLYANSFPGVDFSNYTIESIEADARDGVKIPVSFIYNKSKVNENSVVILYAEYYYKKTMKRGLGIKA